MNTAPMLASVDLGSNSFRLQICQIRDGQIQIIENIKNMVRFAAGLDEQKYLDQASQARALECLAQFGERLRGFDPACVRAVATNTFRVAKNIAGFLPQAEAALGFPIEVIAGREEARLIYTGVVHTYPAEGRKMLVVDIGGGSTEFVIGSSLQPVLTESLPLGCVSYSVRFFADKTNRKTFQAAVNAARSEIQRIAKFYKREGWDITLGTSGTAKSIAAVIAAEGLGNRITAGAMRVLAERIIAAGGVKKAKLDGLKPERVDVFAGGLAVLTAVFEELDIAEMGFTEAALRDGVFYDLIGRKPDTDMREQTVRQFQSRYHVSSKQAARVADLAARLFGETNHYLRWAAMLHEIGLDIAHTAYHKHSAYILEQADMPGFSRPEQQLLAKLALGQRGDLKKMADLLGNDDKLWRAVLALRLAVLFCRARLPDALPPDARLHCENGACVLHLNGAWLDGNPLTSSALHAEREQWRKLGREWVLEAV
ncbi:Ppx/GppA phosphatase family protein [Conchiformibius kuhniae]|uniref:Exopolyphosphatase n=1 Tax=Conchiformibius kuhniae TaxID=211502 RepID=A0ABD8B7E2_9NEIS|nr:Ppx/GppA phosphatase family protein [Conchiformibius kuhniae]